MEGLASLKVPFQATPFLSSRPKTWDLPTQLNFYKRNSFSTFSVRAQVESTDGSSAVSSSGETVTETLKIKEWEVGMLQNEVASSQGIRIRRRPPSGPPLHYVGPFEFRLQNEGNTPRNILEEIVWNKDKEVSHLKERKPLISLKKALENAPPARNFIGALRAATQRLAAEDATLILFARSGDKLKALSDSLKAKHSNLKIFLSVVDVQDHTSLSTAISHIVQQVSHIDVLINNAGLAIGAPSKFPDLQIQDIITMTNTNINGYMFAAYAALNEGKMKERGKGTILNVTSTTGLEVPPFPGEAVYHASKACQEAFTNVLRTELVGTDIKVLALRPGVVATNFHEQRVGYDKESYDTFMTGFEPLVAPDVAEAAAFMLSQKDRVSVKALDVVPTAQRSLQVFDREWNSRDKARNEETMKN